MIDLDREAAVAAALAYLDHPRPLFARLPFDYRRIPQPVRVASLTLARRISRDPRPFPAWPIESSLDAPGGRLTERYRAAVLLTHDVDSRAELDQIEAIRATERKLGIPSSWGFVPGVSWPTERAVSALAAEGCEAYWHDIAHDGRLAYRGIDAIRRAFDEVSASSPWAVDAMRSFRSGQLLMTRDLFTVVSERFDVDLSIPDTERGGPHGRTAGCGTVRPFRFGRALEIPLSLPQDFYLHHVEGLSAADTLQMWQDKFDHVIDVGGVAVLNTHPIWTNPDRPDMWHAYRLFVESCLGREELLITTPSALSELLQAESGRANAVALPLGDAETLERGPAAEAVYETAS